MIYAKLLNNHIIHAVAALTWLIQVQTNFLFFYTGTQIKLVYLFSC